MVTIRITRVFLLLFILGLFACNKVDLPDPHHDGVRYELRGLLNGESFYIGIGTPEFEMVPHTSLDSLNIWRMSGTLKSRYSHGLPHFTISIRNYRAGSNTTLGTQTLIKEGPHRIYFSSGVDKTLYPLQVQIIDDENFKIDSISFQDHTVPTYANEGTIHLESPQSLAVNFNYALPDGTKCVIQTQMDTEHQHQVLVIPNWHVSVVAENRAKLKVHVNDHELTQFSSIRWSTGQTTQEIEVMEPGWYGVTFTDIEGKSYAHSKYLYKHPNDGFITHGNQLKVLGDWLDPILEPDLEQLGGVELTFTDENGKVYRPVLESNTAHRVQIKRVNSPRIHPNQAISFDVEVSFSAVLESDEGDSLNFENISGIISIGIPE